MREYEVNADKTRHMIAPRQRHQGSMGYVFGTLLHRRIPRIRFPNKEQTWHGHGREDVIE
jgi:hypothetical protein